MVELVDTQDLESCGETRTGSIPAIRTKSNEISPQRLDYSSTIIWRAFKFTSAKSNSELLEKPFFWYKNRLENPIFLYKILLENPT